MWTVLQTSGMRKGEKASLDLCLISLHKEVKSAPDFIIVLSFLGFVFVTVLLWCCLFVWGCFVFQGGLFSLVMFLF